MSSVVLDAWAALAFLQREGHASVAVRRLLRRAVRGNVRLLMNVVNLGEVYYRLVQVAGRDVRLTPTEFDLLAAFMSAPSQVFSRQALLNQVQGTDSDSFDRAIDVHIRNLRTKIEPDPSHPRYIETVFGVGYRLCAEPPEE